MTSKWTDAALLAARGIGDPEADALAERILADKAGSGGVSRGGYNHLLDLADVLVAHPELALVTSSLVRQGLDEAGEVAAFFAPLEAPDWVDEKKLALASSLWQTDSILAIFVLYAASLPACYLMKKGVPALYQTEKLAEHQYVFQRIYETGLMLDGVLHQGGLQVIQDYAPCADKVFAKVLNEADPGGRWEWRGHRLHRGATGSECVLDEHAVRSEFNSALSQAKRYIWGGGFIAARKVRLLHASMRVMLQNPGLLRPAAAPAQPSSFMEDAAHRTTAWDEGNLGKPVNQEDLAFTLLTFSYLIPKGMDIWGRKVPKEQKEAFLHLWRVVGHVMGIQDELMTDQWDEAAALYEQILTNPELSGESAPGRILTVAVMDFLRAYLPNRFGLSKVAPAALIVDQLGPHLAQMLVPEDQYKSARRRRVRIAVGLVKAGLRAYYWLSRHVLAHLPFVAGAVSARVELASETLINSWRDSFRRKPFYIPSQATTWVMQRGVTPEFEASLMRWRQKLFDTVAATLVSLILAGSAFGAGLLFFLLEKRVERNIALGVSAIAFVLAELLLQLKLPSVASTRPRIDND
jgi:hypothetical protein